MRHNGFWKIIVNKVSWFLKCFSSFLSYLWSINICSITHFVRFSVFFLYYLTFFSFVLFFSNASLLMDVVILVCILLVTFYYMIIILFLTWFWNNNSQHDRHDVIVINNISKHYFLNALVYTKNIVSKLFRHRFIRNSFPISFKVDVKLKVLFLYIC